MKRKFEPYVPVISRFCGSSSRIGELPDLPDYESSASEPSTSPAAKRARLAQVTHRNLRLLDQKLAKHGEATTLSKDTSSQLDAEDPILATYSVNFRKMVPTVTAETPVEAIAPSSFQPLMTMFAALPEAEQRLFAASNPMASIIKGKTGIAEEVLRMEKETTAYLLTKVSELQTLLTEAKQVNANKSRDFGMFTKIELRNFMTSHGPAKEIIDELVIRGVSERALERSRGLSNEDMYKLYCEHPDVGEQFEKHLKEALVDYKLHCKDSYMQALREVEKDTKAWLGFQKENFLKAVAAGGIVDVDIDGLVEEAGLSPAVRALQKPMMWATPDVPRDPAKAVESVREAAEKARASLEGVKKRKHDLDMNKESVHKRIMRNMGDRHS